MRNIQVLFLTSMALLPRIAGAGYGDADGDGLDAWQEAKAGTMPTNAHSFSAVRLDYDWATNSTGCKTMGEAYDDGDLMPPAWEVAHGIDPDRFDADSDPDGDGWTNFEEWIAGSDPGDPLSVPSPRMEIKAIYDGTNTLAGAPLRFMSYSARSNQRIDGGTNLFLPFGGVPDSTYEAQNVPPSRLATVADWQAVGPAHARVVRGGYNRLLGWRDLNRNGRFDPRRSDGKHYEPMGLSLYNAVLAGPDSFKATIPLTDELFGFPRISWPASTNANVTSYKVYVWTGTGRAAGPDDGITVEAPRTFLHEGDWLEAGCRGMDLGDTDSGVFQYYVFADNDSVEELVAEGSFVASAKPNNGSRRTMKAVSPVAESTVYGSLVEFKWEMDWRTEGVFFTVKDSSGTAVPGLNNLYVPLPVRHNKVTDDDYYYTYIPQLENGRGIVPLPSGTYTYTIKENIRSTAVSAQSVTGLFTINNEEDDSRARASIKGHVHYYGRLPASDVPGKVVVQAYEVSNRARTSLSIGGNPVARATVSADGSFELAGLKAGTYGIVGWVDTDGDECFSSVETQGFGFLGNNSNPGLPSNWCPALAITNGADYAAVDLEDVHVVLRDRDPNSDGVPDDSSFPHQNSVATRMATYLAMPLRTFPEAVPAGFDWITPSIFSTNRWE